ncbi:F-box associated ubiquitination effector family protein [Arabidopsis thaliana]|uniref:F-box associated ubiquitination effector family protein n=1 Tax=Arabidopsis thaliana TaxID=3702 RepID=F4K8V7_ARATH|nr:F-box associated ubiquitination effector family protein [Arabidopsis thaliana]AED95099.1 F-box associated ubiquitination effector family protein [Arabidopsis thaliana]|eukprot:NP_680391.1 F-box associated ubiquitination effector family protein [Arabidopsis thaliana]
MSMCIEALGIHTSSSRFGSPAAIVCLRKRQEVALFLEGKEGSGAGYDPVEKQYKVLTWFDGFEEYQVLTLGIGEPSWRNIKCCRPHLHYPLYKGICINGVLYYVGTVTGLLKDFMVVCFDVKYENFRFVEEGDAYLRLVGVTQRNEIVLATCYAVPFYLFYYNMERKTIIRLQIQGMEVFP